jgi:uncharacterized protein (DUF849 family)
MAANPREAPEPLIVNLAPTGAVNKRSTSPAVPLQPDEIVRDVLACADLGVTLVHLHARDQQDQPTHRKDIYARIIGGLRERRPDLILCASCSGRGGQGVVERSEVLDLPEDLRPDMASLTLSSLNFIDGASINAPDVVAELALRMRDRGVMPELEAFDLGMVNMLRPLTRRGLLKPPYYVNMLLGNIASAQARFLDIGAMAAGLPAETLYALAGIGAAQLPVAAMAAAAAPGVRIGLEDNLWLDPQRRQLATNAALVERVHDLARLVGRSIMSSGELRKQLGLRPR